MPVSRQDLKAVLKSHRVRVSDAIEDARQALEDQDERIEEATGKFDDEDDKEAARLSEIEDILIESDVIEEPKRFECPEPEEDLNFLDKILTGVGDD